jgi:hypothetical protein
MSTPPVNPDPENPDPRPEPPTPTPCVEAPFPADAGPDARALIAGLRQNGAEQLQTINELRGLLDRAETEVARLRNLAPPEN